MIIHKITPAIISIVLLIISSINWHNVIISDLMPYTPYICVFYWALFSPSLLPRWFIIIFGLVVDVLYYLPLGLNSIIMLLMWSFIVSQRQYIITQPFWVLWAIFASIMLCFLVLKWTFLSVVLDYSLVLDDVFLKFISTTLFYPLFAYIFSLLQSKEIVA